MATYTKNLTLTPRVLERLAAAQSHISHMRYERQGWGRTAMDEVNDTSNSLMHALEFLFDADEVWIDGGTGLSFGGRMGTMVFGLIARESDAVRPEFEYKPVNWTVHS